MPLTEEQAQDEMYLWAETQKDLLEVERTLDNLWKKIRERRLSLLGEHPGLRLGRRAE